MDVIVFCKHDVIILIFVIKDFRLFPWGWMILEKDSSFWLSPILVHVFEFLFLFRLSDGHIMNKFIHATNILEPRLMIPDNVWMIQGWKERYFI